jgi:serine phosphatase RsbU (regulator of sigma subunit)
METNLQQIATKLPSQLRGLLRSAAALEQPFAENSLHIIHSYPSDMVSELLEEAVLRGILAHRIHPDSNEKLYFFIDEDIREAIKSREIDDDFFTFYFRSHQQEQRIKELENDNFEKNAELLLQLAKNYYDAQQNPNWNRAIAAMTETLSKALNQVTRVSIWRYDSSLGSLICLDTFDKNTQKHTNGAILKESEYPVYFQKIRTQTYLQGDNVREESDFSEFIESYIIPNNIYSILDIPFFVQGMLAGVICFENLYQVHAFQKHEIHTATAMCGIVALAYQTLQNKQEENEIREMYQLLLEQNRQIKATQHQLILQHRRMTDSIGYAKRIQDAMLPPFSRFNQLFDDFFIFFRPLDTVSGDFYWLNQIDDKIIIAVADCTGHGVPGAFMSLIGSTLLDEIIVLQGITKPELVLRTLHQRIIDQLRQYANESHDGMDIGLCVIDTTEKTLTFSGAKIPLIYAQNGVIKKVEGDRFSLGGFFKDYEMGDRFLPTVIQLDKDNPTSFYLFSDGLQDQFGSSLNKKFSLHRITQILEEIHNLQMNEQLVIIENSVTEWMTTSAIQIDDMLMVGFKV